MHMSSLLAAGEQRSMYGVTKFSIDLDNENCCRLHRSFDNVAMVEEAALEPRQGTHPIIAGLRSGITECCASARVLERDVEFLAAALLLNVPGFAYVRVAGLPAVSRWGNGTPVGVGALGSGYCYIPMFRGGFRMRVARLLGPYPLLSELLVLLRVAGEYKVKLRVYVVAQGVLHLSESEASVSMTSLVVELLGYLQLDPGCRIGGMDESVVRPSVTNGDRGAKGPCAVCGFPSVKLEGHELRCRVRAVDVSSVRAADVVGVHELRGPYAMYGTTGVYDPRRVVPVSVDVGEKLLGDARHALDVKMAMVAFMPPGTHYTVVAQRYLSGSAQRRWLEDNVPNLLRGVMSDHTAGDVFEAYYQYYRWEYLLWLGRDLGVDDQVVQLLRAADCLGDDSCEMVDATWEFVLRYAVVVVVFLCLFFVLNAWA